jgi:simple sugar transport system ATP-binding protein
LRRLRDDGCAIVFVSHKLNEVMALCDRVTVLRRGEVVGERAIGQTDVHDLTTLMVGRELESAQPLPAKARHTETPCLKLDNLSGGILRDVTMQVGAGEIVGLAGVDGNGQRELVDLLCGLRAPESGSFSITPLDENSSQPPIGLIPPDRQSEGLVLSFDLAENMALHPALRTSCRKGLLFNWPIARACARDLIQRFDVRTPAALERSAARNLSGGNQQKVVIARALSFGPSLVIAVDPTRGLDIGAATFVHQQLQNAASEGVAVLLISTDLDEVMALSHRIGVLYEGRLLPGEQLLPSGTSREVIGTLMGGSTTRSGQEVGDGVC